jgi:hypothetical protein
VLISIDIPESLLEEARALANRERTTVEALVIEALQTRVSRPPVTPGLATLPTRALGQAFVDVSDNEAVRVRLEDDADEN